MVSGCAHKKFDRIRVIHFTDDFSRKSSVGVIKVKYCKYSSGKASVGKELSFEKAYEELKEKKGGLQYIENLVFQEDSQSVSDLSGKKIAGKDCIIVKGNGYK